MAASNGRRLQMAREPIRPDRLRVIDPGGFAFVPNRFLRDGFFASLAPDELRLYLLLVLAGDRRGLSYYHYDTLCSILELGLDDYITARNGLIETDLVAYDGTRFQVLALPHAPKPRAAKSFEPPVSDDGNEIRRSLLEALRRPID
jgi:hypothetical protein